MVTIQPISPYGDYTTKDKLEKNLKGVYHVDVQLWSSGTAVQLVYNPFSQFVSQLELYSQLQLSLQSDPIGLGVPIST